MMQPGKWWIGLPPLAVLFTIAATMNGEKIEGDIAERARAALGQAQSADVGDASVAVEGRDVTVSGVALSPQAAEPILSAIEKQEGVRAVIDKTAAPTLVQPFVTSFERRGKILSVAGYEPPGGRARLRDLAAGKGLELADEARLALGAPANAETLTGYALALLEALGDGKVSLSDAALTATGAPASFDAYDRALAALSAPPAGIVVKAADIAPPRVAPFVWSATKSAASVALFGYVPSPQARDGLAGEAAALAGAASVADQSRIASGAPVDFAAAAHAALAALAGLDSGKATLTDARLTIEGAGKANVAAASVAADLRAALPKGFSVAETKIAAGPVSPYVLTARKQDGTLALTGYAPDQATRAGLISAAGRRFGGEIDDGLAVAAGSPDSFARAADVALRAVARLRTGAAGISDRRVAIEGAAYTGPGAEDIKARLAAQMPQGYEVSARLGVASPAEEIAPGELRAAIASTVAPGFSFGADRSALDEDSLPIADALAFVLLRSPGAAIDIIGYFGGAASPAENETIARRRAEALRDYLVAAGVDSARLTATAGGGAPAESEAPPRRIEFMVK